MCEASMDASYEQWLIHTKPIQNQNFIGGATSSSRFNYNHQLFFLYTDHHQIKTQKLHSMDIYISSMRERDDGWSSMLCNCNCPRPHALVRGRRRWTHLLLLHRDPLFSRVHIYLLLSALFTAERCIPSEKLIKTLD